MKLPELHLERYKFARASTGRTEWKSNSLKGYVDDRWLTHTDISNLFRFNFPGPFIAAMREDHFQRTTYNDLMHPGFWEYVELTSAKRHQVAVLAGSGTFEHLRWSRGSILLSAFMDFYMKAYTNSYSDALDWDTFFRVQNVKESDVPGSSRQYVFALLDTMSDEYGLHRYAPGLEWSWCLDSRGQRTRFCEACAYEDETYDTLPENVIEFESITPIVREAVPMEVEDWDNDMEECSKKLSKALDQLKVKEVKQRVRKIRFE